MNVCTLCAESEGMSLLDPASVQRCLLEYKPYEGSAVSVTPPPHLLSLPPAVICFSWPVPANGGANNFM